MKWKIAALLVLLASPARADERIGSFVLPDDEPTVIRLDGDIEEHAVDEFRAALEKRPGATTLTLSSRGGYTQQGVALGYEVKARALATYVPPDAFCMSACVTILMAGRPRKADGLVAVHQSTSGVIGGNALRTNVPLVRALAAFETPQPMIDALFATPNEGAYFFSQEELQAYGLTD